MVRSERMLRVLLILAGAVCLLGLAAVVMPREWMAACHERLGLGVFPEGPIVEYLARSVAGLYGILGGLMLLAAANLRRYRGVITYIAVTHLGFAVVLLGIDIGAGLPWYWTACEVSATAAFGAAVLMLQMRMPAGP